MGKLADLLSTRPRVAPALTGPTFAVDETAIDPAVFGLTSYAAPSAIAPRIDRRAAMQVPAVKRSRDLIAGSLGQLPIDLYGPDRQKVPSTLLEQPEVAVPRSVTMTRTVEDMLFEGIAWWRVVSFDPFTNYPDRVERLKPGRVAISEDRRRCPGGAYGCTGSVTVDGKHEHDGNLIRFDSPNDPLLVTGARAIRTCLGLDSAASRFADGVPPVDYFTPADPDNEPSDPQAVVDAWADARRRNATGYVPGALKYNIGGWSPEQLQLADARQHAVLEIAREAGVDPEELGVSTTSRTYANQFDRRKAFLDFTLGGYVSAIQDRLSMGDVAVPGHFARFNLDAFLRTDALSRYQAYIAGRQAGALTGPEVRQLEDRPPLTEDAAPMPAPVAALPVVSTFDTEPELRFDAPNDPTTFEVDRERRIIRGMAVPYGSVAMSRGQRWQFAQGTLKFAAVNRVKLWVQHDAAQAVGVAFELDDRPEGLFAGFKVARGPAGDHALTMAEDGVWDGLSIGLGQGGKYRRVGDVNQAIEAPLMEISLTPAPSFDDARVHQVAASAVDTERHNMTDTAVVADAATDAPTDAPALDFSSVTDALTGAVRDGFAALANPQGGRTVVPAGGALEVREELPYRFDGIAGAHGFVEDIRDAYFSHDSAARQRLETFLGETFAVTSANAAALNPTQNRPELYVPNLTFTRPLYDLVSKGNITDKTPFTVPKFASAAGLVGPHTEGVEPTPGSFTATPQTVSPGPMSGKIEILREVWDAGGSPQSDGIIWGEMVNAWYEAIEANIKTLLAGSATAELNLASAVDSALDAALTAYYAGLQFVRGGNRFTATAADAKLFPALIAAKDTAGRKLFPVLGPANASGQTSGAFDAVAVGNQRVAAAWALAQGANTRSYNFVPSSVWCWTSAPQRFTFEYQVKSIDMAIWGYCGTAILRDSDVKPIDYDASDV